MIYSSTAKRFLKKLSPELRKNINNELDELTDNPYNHNLVKIKSSSKTPVYRIRICEYRAIFLINDFKLIILVLEIEHRKKVYRKY